MKPRILQVIGFPVWILAAFCHVAAARAGLAAAGEGPNDDVAGLARGMGEVIITEFSELVFGDNVGNLVLAPDDPVHFALGRSDAVENELVVNRGAVQGNIYLQVHVSVHNIAQATVAKLDISRGKRRFGGHISFSNEGATVFASPFSIDGEIPCSGVLKIDGSECSFVSGEMRWGGHASQPQFSSGTRMRLANDIYFSTYEFSKGTWNIRELAPQDVLDLKAAAESGAAKAQVKYGNLFFYGGKVPVNNALALSWYRKAAKQGDAMAMKMVGGCYRGGYGVAKDPDAAEAWFQKAFARFSEDAKTGDLEAAWQVALAHFAGRGTVADEAAGYGMVEEAANAGLDKAQNYLGNAYSSGGFYSKDAEAALSWWTKAADQGLKEAQASIGDYYYNASRFEQAAQWFKQAAEQGEQVSQLNLGTMFYKGLGVEKDLMEAKQWFLEAWTQGGENAQYARNWLLKY